MSDPAPPVRSRSGWAVFTATAVVTLFLLAALPLAIWQFTSNSDEARYTVAAARMMATGDYIVPEAAWGEVRLLKPPLTYYFIVVGFALFGQSVIGAKALWLTSSGLILALTWALARSLGASRAGGAVAVAALAGNILWYRSTLIHNPDIPMVLGLTVALVAVVRIVSQEQPRPWTYWALWLGIAFAFQAKGLLAVVLAILVILFRSLARGFGRPSRSELWAVGAGLVAALWWHVAVAIREPEALLAQFVGDQVTGKAEFDPTRILGGVGYDLFFLLIGFLPVLAMLFPTSLRGAGRPSAAITFLIVWCLLIVVVFAFSNYLSERYMLPAMPAVASLIGLGLGRLAPAEIGRRAARAVRILLPVPLLVGLVTTAVVFAGATVLAALGALAAVLSSLWLLWWLAGRRRPGTSLTLLALLAPLTFLSVFPAYQILARPAAADLAVREVRVSGLPTDRVAVLRRWHLLERVGLQVPPIEGYRFAVAADPEVLEGAGLVLTIFPNIAEELRALGYEVRAARGAPQGFGAGDLAAAIARRDLAGFRETYGEPLFLATPPAERSSGPLLLEMDQIEVPAVDEDAKGLAEDEDRIGPVDGVGEQHDSAAE